MPTITDGLVEVTLEATLGGRGVANVWYFKTAADRPAAELADLLGQIDALYLPLIAAIQSDAVDYTLWIARDVMGITADAQLVPTIVDGLNPGQVINNFSAMRIDLLPLTKETRRGYKRFAGIPEDLVSGNILDPILVADMALLAAVFNDGFATANEVYGPIIYGGPTIAEPLRSVYNPIINATSSNQVTSQLSRKT